jgi:hypothetical protein
MSGYRLNISPELSGGARHTGYAAPHLIGLALLGGFASGGRLAPACAERVVRLPDPLADDILAQANIRLRDNLQRRAGRGGGHPHG